MLHDMDEIDNIEKARAIESIIQSMKNFNISIDDLIEQIQPDNLQSLGNKNILNSADNYLFRL
jgi:hypothetical protein